MQIFQPDKEVVKVKQFQLTNWNEDEPLPPSKKDLLELIELLEKWQQKSANGPITIHCM